MRTLTLRTCHWPQSSTWTGMGLQHSGHASWEGEKSWNDHFRQSS